MEEKNVSKRSDHGKLSYKDAAAIAGVLAMSSAAMAGPGGEPFNDSFPGDFYVAIDDAITIQGDLEDRGCGDGYGGGYGGSCGPDTTLGILDDKGSVLFTDDDGSFLGDGLASGLFLIDVNQLSGTVNWAVSGFPDFNFDGLDDETDSPHFQFGAWEGFIDFFDSEKGFISGEYLGFYDFTQPDEVFFGSETVPEGAAFFDIYLDNQVGGDCACGDVDFQVVTGLEPFQAYEVRVTSADFDTILQTYDAFGSPLNFNDDDPDAGCCLSVLVETADENGEIYFAISEFADQDFIGQHSAFGFWEISVTSACQVAVGCARADTAEPFGVLDLADINAFVGGFVAGDCISDYDDNGIYDLADINAFVASFTGGCL